MILRIARFYSLQAFIITLSACFAIAQQPATVPQNPPTAASGAVQHNSSYIEPDGTAHIGRVVPVPQSLSPQAKAFISRPETDEKKEPPLPQRRQMLDTYRIAAKELWLRICPGVTVASDTMGGVPILRVNAAAVPADNGKVLLELHGGGFDSDSGSISETIPIAFYTQMPVVAALYRLAPEHPFPAAVDDAVAVYRELLKSHKPSQIGIYGTSAGAILTGEVAVRLKQLSLPEPAALGIFSGLGDFSAGGDSMHLYSLNGFSGYLPTPDGTQPPPPYAAQTNLKDPVLSPMYADLRGMPPSLFITSGRDLLLSGTINLHRAFLRAGNEAQLVVFEGLPHAFWYNPALPESIEANKLMAKFLSDHVQ